MLTQWLMQVSTHVAAAYAAHRACDAPTALEAIEAAIDDLEAARRSVRGW